MERYTLEAIERAKGLVSTTGVYNAVVTARGSAMALVRWNQDAAKDANDPCVEVIRFAEQLCPY
jgi:hypothetical protein